LIVDDISCIVIVVGHSGDCDDGHCDHDEFFYSGDDDEEYDSYDNLLFRMLFDDSFSVFDYL